MEQLVRDSWFLPYLTMVQPTMCPFRIHMRNLTYVPVGHSQPSACCMELTIRLIRAYTNAEPEWKG